MPDPSRYSQELMQTMLAAVLDSAPGGLRIEEIPVPEPRANEVLVKVHACGVCHTDLHVMKAEVAFPTPAVLGHEISGTVAALGPGVAGSRRRHALVVSAFIMPCGFCRLCAIGRDDLCDNFFAMNRLKGTLYDGTTRLRRTDGTPIAMYSMAGLAEYAVVPATDVFPLPDGLPLAESSVLGCARLHGLRRGPARRRSARRRARRRRRGRRRRPERSSRSPRRSARRRSSRSTSATTSSRSRAASARPTSSTRSTTNATERVRELTGRPRRGRRVRGARPARDVHAGVRDHRRRRPHGRRRHRAGQDDRAGRDHAAGAPRAADHRLVRRAHARRHAGDHPPRRAGHRSGPRRSSRGASRWTRPTPPTRRWPAARSSAGRSSMP